MLGVPFNGLGRYRGIGRLLISKLVDESAGERRPAPAILAVADCFVALLRHAFRGEAA
jgi:hypothetical protein